MSAVGTNGTPAVQPLASSALTAIVRSPVAVITAPVTIVADRVAFSPTVAAVSVPVTVIVLGVVDGQGGATEVDDALDPQQALTDVDRQRSGRGDEVDVLGARRLEGDVAVGEGRQDDGALSTGPERDGHSA